MVRSGAWSILLAALSTLPAACSSSSSSAPPAAPPPAAALPPRPRHGRHGHDRRSRRRFLCLRQRRLAEGHADPARQGELRRRKHPQRPDPAADRRAHPGRRQGRAGRQRGDPQGRRLLRRLHGRGRHRGQGPGAAEAGARCHREDRRPPRPGPRHRRHHPRRRRSAERHQLRDGAPVRRVDRAGHAGPRPQHAVPAAGRPRPAGSRLLRVAEPEDGGAAQGLRTARRRGARPDGCRRRQPARRGDRRSRDADGRGPRHARAVGRREPAAGVDARGAGGEGARPRLAGPARRGRAAGRARVHRLASGGGDRARRAGWQRAARGVEGLAGVPHRQHPHRNSCPRRSSTKGSRSTARR